MKKPAYNILTLQTLQKLFEEEEDKLSVLLSSGMCWKEAKQQRILLTDLAEAIFKKCFPNARFNRNEFKYNVEDVAENNLRTVTERNGIKLLGLSVSCRHLCMN